MAPDGLQKAAWRRRNAALGFTTLAGLVAAGLLVLLHPLGYAISIGIAVVAMVVLCLVIARVGKPLRQPEAEKYLTELPDQALKGKDDLDEPARWVP